MVQPLREGPRAGPQPDELLSMAFDRPAEAVEAAEAVLAGSPGPVDASVAHQTIGLVQRDFGELPSAIEHLRTAVALARKGGSQAREADVLATLGIALVHAGRSGAGIRSLDRSVALSTTPVAAARARLRRAGALEVLGRHEPALRDLRVALPALRASDDTLYTARAFTLRALIHLAAGHTDRADRDFRAAELIYDDSGQRLESAVARQNRGLLAFRAGDLPKALAYLDEAEQRFLAIGSVAADLAFDRCGVLLAANPPADALAVADAAAARMHATRGMATRRAELALLGAKAALAAGDHTDAARRAAESTRTFAAQGRRWWHAHARLLRLQAVAAGGAATGRVLSGVVVVAGELVWLGSPDVVQADLLAGRIALGLGRQDVAAEHLERAAAARHRGPAAARVTGWLAQALLAEAAGDRRAIAVACRRGLAVLDEHRTTLGASELQARATEQGSELAAIALRAGLRGSGARQLLVWSDRWRATACAVPPVRPPDDREALVELAALRGVTNRIEESRRAGVPSETLDRERDRLERRVRSRALRAPGGSAPPGLDRLDVPELLAALGADRLVEIAAIDGQVHVLICGAGRVRRIATGRVAAVTGLVEQARWVLRRHAYVGQPAGRLADLGVRLEAELLGAAAAELGEGAVHIVPPARLQGVPWALLPSLTGRPHGVAPSARAWLRARAIVPPSDGGTVVVRGPDLGAQGSEVEAVAGLHPGARLRQGDAAGTAAVLDVLDGCALAHIAAHGEFRAESPMFSALRLADGPLTVYDLERLRRAPYRMVLPCCDSGRMQPVGADEVLGLAAALISLGTAGLVTALVPVNDAATVPLMIALHESVAAGASLPTALHAARAAVDNTPTALAFTVFGV